MKASNIGGDEMNAEQYYKSKLNIGSKLRRFSDGTIFEVTAIKDVKEFGRDVSLYTLKAPSGYEFPFTSHAIDIGLEITN